MDPLGSAPCKLARRDGAWACARRTLVPQKDYYDRALPDTPKVGFDSRGAQRLECTNLQQRREVGS